MGGVIEDILHDLEVIKEADLLGLTRNNSKSEIICHDAITWGTIIASLPGAQVIHLEKASLLGSPLGQVNSISTSIEEKRQFLKIMGDRFQLLSAHDALILLHISFAIPKLQ